MGIRNLYRKTRKWEFEPYRHLVAVGQPVFDALFSFHRRGKRLDKPDATIFYLLLLNICYFISVIHSVDAKALKDGERNMVERERGRERVSE